FGLKPLLNVVHATRQVVGLRARTLPVVRFDDLDGMISFPSFHVALGSIVTWISRRRWWAVLPLALVNVRLTAAPLPTGVRYVVVLIASVLLVGARLFALRQLGGAPPASRRRRPDWCRVP